MTITLRSLHTVVPETVLVQEQIREAFLVQPGLTRLAERLISTSFDESGIATRHTVITGLGADPAAISTDIAVADTAVVDTGAASSTEAHHIRPDPSRFFDPANGELLLPGTELRNELFESEAQKLFIAAANRSVSGAAGIEPSDVTHVITVSCTGCYAPGPDFAIAQALGLRPDVQRYHIGFVGCHASMPALRAATQFCEANDDAVVLVVSVELCTLHLRSSTNPDTIVASSLFADGAGAGIVSARPLGEAEAGYRLDRAATMIAGAGATEMTWTIGDHGFNMVLSTKVPQLIGNSIMATLQPLFAHDPLLNEAFTGGTIATAVPHWAIHPGGRAILDRVQSQLELSDAQMVPARDILSRFGNMSSTTILFVLQRILEDAAARHGDRVAAVGFGPGLTIESALMTVCRGH